MALAPGTHLGSYEVAALIGAGGMGAVYRARDTKLDCDVALKVRTLSSAVRVYNSAWLNVSQKVPCDPENSTRLMTERYTDIVSLIRRADQVKREFLGRGWREPEQHEHGSRAYGRLTLVRPPCSTEAVATVTTSEKHSPQDEPTWCQTTHRRRASLTR